MDQPLTFRFEDDGTIPNSPLPLLVYRGAVPPDPAEIERIFAANAWPPAWRDAVHPFHHFHTNTHEALGVAQGEAEVLFGGPGGEVLQVRAGDVVVIPAGVGHCNQSQSADLLIVGAYPAAAPHADLHRGAVGAHDAEMRAIGQVAVPAEDPVTGAGGPLVGLWKAKG